MLSAFIAFLFTLSAQQAEYNTIRDISYYSEEMAAGDEYISERCVLDIYYPTNRTDFATIVWFHGGGLSGGGKELPHELKDKGFCIIGVNYRLAPRAKAPDYVEDAAAAIAWAFENVEQYGGSKSKIFVSGHSAGGYLAMMTGLDKSYLARHNIDANDIAGIIPFSGQAITHFSIRDARGIKDTQPVVDKYAPLYHVRSDASPMLLITGDREMEMLGRYEENAYLARMMKVAGHKETRLFELQGYGHNMAYPAYPLLIDEISRILKN